MEPMKPKAPIIENSFEYLAAEPLSNHFFSKVKLKCYADGSAKLSILTNSKYPEMLAKSFRMDPSTHKILTKDPLAMVKLLEHCWHHLTSEMEIFISIHSCLPISGSQKTSVSFKKTP